MERRHVAAQRIALSSAGLTSGGYYAWSLFDNFEWGHGYSNRFGIIHVNFESLKRTIKRSGHVYREIIASHGKTALN